MAQSYFCKIKGAVHGPLSGKQLRDLAIAGRLLPDSLIRLEGADQWVAAGKFKNLEFSQPERAVVLQPVSSLPPPPKSPQPICTHCGKELGLFRGLEGRKIICQHCNKITLVISRAAPLAPAPRVAPRVPDSELAELVDGDVSNFANEKSFSSEEKRMPGLMVFGGVSLIIGAVITLWVIIAEGISKREPSVSQQQSPTPVFKVTEEQISGDGKKRENLAQLAEAKRRAREEEESKKKEAFEKAKKVLLDDLDSVWGSPSANVKKGIEFLKEHLAHPDSPNRAEALLLLEHAKVAVSDEMAIQFLRTINEYDRRKVAGVGDPLDSDGMIIVNQSQLESLSRGFSKHFKNKVNGKNQEEPRIFVCSRSYEGGGKYCNSIETGFYEGLERNAKGAMKSITDQTKKIEDERKKARELYPKLTALIFDLEDDLQSYNGRCMYFENFWMYGKTDKKGEDDYRLQVTDNRGKFYTSIGFVEKQTIFSTSKDIAAQIQSRAREDTKYRVKLYCDIYKTNRGGPWAKVYRIEFFNKDGSLVHDIYDSGLGGRFF